VGALDRFRGQVIRRFTARRERGRSIHASRQFRRRRPLTFRKTCFGVKVLGLGFFNRIRKLGLMDLLDTEKKFDGFFFNAVGHLIEHVKSFALVLHERVPLAVSAESDPLAKIIESVEMLLPFRVDHLKQNVPHEVLHPFRAEFLFPAIQLLAHFFLKRFEQSVHIIHILFYDFAETRAKLLTESRDQSFGILVFFANIRIDVGQHQTFDYIFNHQKNMFFQFLRSSFQHQITFAIDQFALTVHHVIVFKQVFSDLKVVRFDALLRRFHGPAHERMLDLIPFLHPEALHHGRDPVRSKKPHEFIFHGDKKLGGTRIALASAATAKLVVNAPGFMALGTDHRQPAFVRDTGPEHNIRSAARHIRRDRHDSRLSGLRHDLGFFLVILGVEDHMRKIDLLKHAAQAFGFFDRDRSDQDRSSFFMFFRNFAHYCVEFFLLGPVNAIR